MRVIHNVKLLVIFLMALMSFYGISVSNETEISENTELADELDSLITRNGATDISLDFSIADIVARLHNLINPCSKELEDQLRNFNILHESLQSQDGEVSNTVIQEGIRELLSYIELNPEKYKEEIYQSAISNLRNFGSFFEDAEEPVYRSKFGESKFGKSKFGESKSCRPCKKTCKPCIKPCKRLKCLLLRGPKGDKGDPGRQGPPGPPGPAGRDGCCIVCPQPAGLTTGGTANGAARNRVRQTRQACPTGGCPSGTVCPCPPVEGQCPPTTCPVQCPPTDCSRLRLCCQFSTGIINYMLEEGQMNLMSQGCGFRVETLNTDPVTLIVRYCQSPFGTLLVPIVSARSGNPRVTNITSSSFVIINDEPADVLNFAVFPLCR